MATTGATAVVAVAAVAMVMVVGIPTCPQPGVVAMATKGALLGMNAAQPAIPAELLCG